MTSNLANKAPAILVVGHSLKPSVASNALVGDGNEAEVTERLLAAHTLPYGGTFKDVFIVDLRNKQPRRWLWKEDGKTVSLAVASWLLKSYPNAWTFDLIERPQPPQTLFIGFQIHRFLKVLGLECSLPTVGRPVPLSMWYDSKGHRDILDLVFPTECRKHLLLPAVLAQRGIPGKEGWTGPGQDVEEDVRLTTEIAAQIGLVG